MARLVVNGPFARTFGTQNSLYCPSPISSKISPFYEICYLTIYSKCIHFTSAKSLFVVMTMHVLQIEATLTSTKYSPAIYQSSVSEYHLYMVSMHELLKFGEVHEATTHPKHMPD